MISHARLYSALSGAGAGLAVSSAGVATCLLLIAQNIPWDLENLLCLLAGIGGILFFVGYIFAKGDDAE